MELHESKKRKTKYLLARDGWMRKGKRMERPEDSRGESKEMHRAEEKRIMFRRQCNSILGIYKSFFFFVSSRKHDCGRFRLSHLSRASSNLFSSIEVWRFGKRLIPYARRNGGLTEVRARTERKSRTCRFGDEIKIPRIRREGRISARECVLALQSDVAAKRIWILASKCSRGRHYIVGGRRFARTRARVQKGRRR